MTERSEKQIVPEVVLKIRKMWEEIRLHPAEWLKDLQGNIAFVAGGGLPLVFGNPESGIYKAMLAAMEQNDGKIEIAGVSLDREKIELLGEYYRFLRSQGYNLHCIDERLEDDLGHESHHVHEHCGACAATGDKIQIFLPEEGEVSVEDLLLRELNQQQGKQPIYQEMKPHHDSLTIFIDFAGDDAVVNEEKRVALRNGHALAFQVSLQVDMIKKFVDTHPNVAIEQLAEVLVHWNVQIARNIIGGTHNALSGSADFTTLILDKRGVKPEGREIFHLLKNIFQVKHQAEIFID